MTETFIRDVELLILSHHPAIHFKTYEYDRVDALLKRVADKLQMPLFIWESGKGLYRRGERDIVYGTRLISLALDNIAASTLPAIYHFHSFVPLQSNHDMIGSFQEAVRPFMKKAGVVVISDGELEIPTSLANFVLPMHWPSPSQAEFRDLFNNVISDFGKNHPVTKDLGEQEIARFLENMKGLTLDEAKRILLCCLLDDGCIDASDQKKFFEHKKKAIEKDGLMEFYCKDESLDDIAGLTALKEWLAKRKQLLTSPQNAAKFNLPFPKGLLLIGVQGCGKSLCAKAVAKEWQLPILKLEPARLLDKYVGESEKRFMKAIKQAESMAPIILWIDEIEKIFEESGEGDGGTSQRILGIFLSWMQDRAGDVFVVATANNIQKLPAEFVRKGRFDEIFFVDLPLADIRSQIFQIHLKKHNQNGAMFDLELLSKVTEGFSGAEIEQVVVSGLYTAMSQNTPLSDKILTNEAALTRPLSVIMTEKVGALRRWAEGRAVKAN